MANRLTNKALRCETTRSNMGFDFNTDDDGGNDSNNNSSSGKSRDIPDRPDPEGDYDYHPRLYNTEETVVEGDLGNFFTLEHDDYGQTLILFLDDVEIVQGALYDKDQSDDNQIKENKVKLFNFDSLGYDVEEIENGDLSLGDLPPRKTQSAFGNNMRFEYMGSRIDGDDPVVDNPDTLKFPTMRIFYNPSTQEGNEGPSAIAKRIVKLLAEGGAGDLNDENLDQIHNWTDSYVRIADDLKGRRVQMWHEKREGDEYNYNHQQIKDVETGDLLEVRNGGEEADSQAADADDSSSDAGAAADGSGAVDDQLAAMEDELAGDDEDGFSDEMEKVISWMVGKEITEEENVRQAFEKVVDRDMVSAEETFTDDGSVRDDIVDEVQNRA